MIQNVTTSSVAPFEENFVIATVASAASQPPSHLRSMVIDDTPEPEGIEVGMRSLSIRTVNSNSQRESASLLVNKRYAWRGYQCNGVPDHQTSDCVTLVGSDDDVTVGTMTIGFDGPQGILADDAFSDVIDQVRNNGREICEFTKLAMESSPKSMQTLASMVHVAYILARRVRGADDVFIEVNPRHVRYYQRMLGFKVVGMARENRRVHAPGVLLSLDLAWGLEQIAKFNGCGALAMGEKSLYPFFYSVEEENRIFHRLRHQVQ